MYSFQRNLFRVFVSLVVIGLCGCNQQNQEMAQPKAIIVGATSGIGEALAKELASRGYVVGLMGRREHLLKQIQQEISTKTFAHVIDVAQPEQAQGQLRELIDIMGGLDLIVINAGTGNYDLAWDKQKEIIAVNVIGFAAMASVATDYFLQHGAGHIVAISSIAALRGMSGAPVYSASKAFVSNYMDGLRARFKKMDIPIYVSTIEPGAVDTAMGKDVDFWRATPEKAAQQISDAIQNKSEHAYVTKRWRLIAGLFKLLPDWLFYKIFS